jgi:hypothetical protein
VISRLGIGSFALRVLAGPLFHGKFNLSERVRPAQTATGSADKINLW